jgi:hypothetical protein
MVAAIGTGDAFTKGRDFAAWLGLVPKQISTGDRTILGKICVYAPSRPGLSRRASQPKPISCPPAAIGCMKSSTTASESLHEKRARR